MTLNKSEALFSPSTLTRDLALGPSLFQWDQFHIIQHEQADLARESFADHPRSFDDVIVRPSWKPY